MAVKPSIPKGTRDFSPKEMIKRNYIFDTIKEVFNRYGFLPIETPAMENLSTLMGKYGDEGDKLIFKIANNGEYTDLLAGKYLTALTEYIAASGNIDDKNKLDDALNYLKNKLPKKTIEKEITEKALHYDLTVPFARYVVMHKDEINFPFRRYQIQPVWRADRPQKGRYREFYQCDADIIGSNSLLNELVLIQLINEIFKLLEIKVVILLNNRKILLGIAEYIGIPERFTDITIALDKLDKIGIEKVNDELLLKGISKDSVDKLNNIINLKGENKEILKQLKVLIQNSEIGVKGIEELEYILNLCNLLNIKNDIKFEISLARGLSYYTGTIFEVVAKEMQYSSICGGGRYDDLTGVFGLQNMSGVGISFGADRIYDIIEHLNLFPEDFVTSPKIMLVNFGSSVIEYNLMIIAALRDAGVSAEMYPDEDKMVKQLNYANKKGIKYVLFIGEEEKRNNIIKMKDMKTGEQRELKFEELISEFFI